MMNEDQTYTIDEPHIIAASFEIFEELFGPEDREREAENGAIQVRIRVAMERVFAQDPDDMFYPPMGLLGPNDDDRAFMKSLRGRKEELSEAEKERVLQIMAKDPEEGCPENGYSISWVEGDVVHESGAEARAERGGVH